jgi:hypothetical protein
MQLNSKVKLNGKDIGKIASHLSTSKNTIRKHISQLIKFGLLEKGGNGWIHIVGNTRFSLNNDIELSINAYEFDLEVLKDIKKFRTLLYTIEYEICARTYRKSTCVNNDEIVKQKSKKKYATAEYKKAKAKRDKLNSKNKEVKDGGVIARQIPSPILRIEVSIPDSRYVCAPSFVSSVTNRNHSTIAKHRIRSKEFGFVSYKRTFNVLNTTDDFLIKQNFTTSVKMPIFKFFDAEYNSNEGIKDVCRYSEIMEHRNVFPLFDKKNNVTCIVEEVSPEIIFNIKSFRLKNYSTKEEKRLTKEAYLKIHSAKN